MRYAALRPFDISNGEGIGVALFTQGCARHCKGCFQPETWDFEAGQKFTQKTKEKLFEYLRQPGITRFSLLGGEPLEDCNLFEISRLINLIKREFPDIKIWVYSGYTKEELEERAADSNIKWLRFILDNIDVLVDGPFIEEEKDLSLEWRGSCNQKIYRRQ